MLRWIMVLTMAMVACGSDAGTGDDGDASDAGPELDAAAMPDAAPPTCVAWVDACHVRACPSGEVSTRPDGVPCPAEACGPDGAGKPCTCHGGVCAVD